MTDPVSHAEMIAAVVAATCRREGAARRMREAGNAEVARAIDAEVAALYAAHDVLERHERAMAVVVAAKRVLAGLNARIDAAPGYAVPVFDGIVDLHDVLAALDAAGGAK